MVLTVKIHQMQIFYSQVAAVSPHKHDLWEIIINTEGEGDNYLEGEATKFFPGTITLCPPGTVHHKIASNGSFVDLSVLFSDPYYFSGLRQNHFEDNQEKEIQQLMEIAYHHYHQDKNDRISRNLIEAVCALISEWDNAGQSDERVEALENLIAQNFTNPDFEIGKAMEQMNYCDDYLRRCFKKETGLTPVQYLNQMKINLAKKLLLNATHPRYPISHIAYLSGFYDVGYFSRVFKKLEGVSPTEFSASPSGNNKVK